MVKKEEEAKATDKTVEKPIEKKQSYTDSEKIKLFKDSITKKFGTGTIRKASSYVEAKRISSGVFILDHALGGGWPTGRINLIYGNFSCGKSTLVLRAIADAQIRSSINNKYLWECVPKDRVPYKCLYVDLEGALDTEWAKTIGVDIEALDVCTARTAEATGDIIHAAVSSGGYDIIILDSLAQMIPEKELEGEMADQNMGNAAKINNKLLRKVQSVLNDLSRASEDGKAIPTLFVINQIREKIGVMFGSPDTKTGGRGQDFYSSVMLKVSGNKVHFYDEKEKTMPAYSDFNFVVEKNKVSPPKINGSYRMGLADDPDGKFRLGEIIEAKDLLEWGERMNIVFKDDKNKWVVQGDELEKIPADKRIFNTKTEMVNNWLGNKENAVLLRRQLVKALHPKQ